ncbi:MAG: hypothetical protein Q7R45_08425 [Sulfuricaulis sp.]|nr:hypothetical protein [Sulfuricaulis sp.]
MATGTGLPFEKAGGVTAQPDIVQSRFLSSADVWKSIERDGAKIAAVGLDSIERDVKLQLAGYTASFENGELEYKTNLDQRLRGKPEEYKNEYAAHMAGVMGQVDPRIAPHAERFMGAQMNHGVAAQYAIKNGVIERVAADQVKYRLENADKQIQELSSSGGMFSADGTTLTKQGEALGVTHESILQELVHVGLIAPAHATAIGEDSLLRARGNDIRSGLEKVYESQGVEGAQKWLDERIKGLGATFKDADKLRRGGLQEISRMRQYDNLASTDALRADTIAARQQKRQDAVEEDAIIRDAASDNPILTDKDIKNNWKMSPEARMRMIAWRHRDGLPEPMARVSAATSTDLFRRMNLPDGDPQKLTDILAIREAYAPPDGSRGKLTRADEEWLEKRFIEAKTPTGEMLSRDRGEFFKRYAASIDGAMELMGHSALGSQKLYEFGKDAIRQEDELRKRGEDPHLLYDPASKYFLGKPENIGKYHVSMQESTNYQNSLGGLAKKKPSVNLTAPGTTVTGTQIIDIPVGMAPAEVLKKYSGKRVRLPDGRIMDAP